MHKKHNVALRKEGVDRNPLGTDDVFAVKSSPSARRAWIEIRISPGLRMDVSVALRKEGVDRNEMVPYWQDIGDVALRKEGVDRNREIVIPPVAVVSRPPQGGRG